MSKTIRLLAVFAVVLLSAACGDVLTSPSKLPAPRFDGAAIPDTAGNAVRAPQMPTWAAPGSHKGCRAQGQTIVCA